MSAAGATTSRLPGAVVHEWAAARGRAVLVQTSRHLGRQRSNAADLRIPPLAGTDRGTAHREGRDRQESHVSFPGPFAHRHKSSGAVSRKRAR
jgi:hypothetical protein